MPQKYPHLLKHEVVIWEAFMADHGDEYIEFEYDVHVGRMWVEHENLDPVWKRGAAAVYLKRIDVVGRQANSTTIFEVKPHAGLSALGQVLGYLALYDDSFHPDVDLEAVVVTGLVDPGTRMLLEGHGIKVIEYRGLLPV